MLVPRVVVRIEIVKCAHLCKQRCFVFLAQVIDALRCRSANNALSKSVVEFTYAIGCCGSFGLSISRPRCSAAQWFERQTTRRRVREYSYQEFPDNCAIANPTPASVFRAVSVEAQHLPHVALSTRMTPKGAHTLPDVFSQDRGSDE